MRIGDSKYEHEDELNTNTNLTKTNASANMNTNTIAKNKKATQKRKEHTQRLHRKSPISPLSTSTVTNTNMQTNRIVNAKINRIANFAKAASNLHP